MADTTSIVTPDHVTLDLELAGLGTRFLAWLLDFVLIMLSFMGLILVLMVVVPSAMSFGGAGEDLPAWTVALVILVFFVVNWGYALLFESTTRGQTPGKKAMGIRVIREDGLPIGLREAALRNLVRAADMMPPPCYILGGIVLHFDARSRRLGDMVAGTLVVRERFELDLSHRVGAAWAARVEQGQSRQGLTLPRGEISAQKLALMEQYLDRFDTLPQARREALSWQIVEPILPLLEEDLRPPQAYRARWAEDLMRRLLKMSETTSGGARGGGAKGGKAMF